MPDLLFPGGALVAQLDDVDPAGQDAVDELGQVAALPAGIGAQVQSRLVEPRCKFSVRFVHMVTLTVSVNRDMSDESLAVIGGGVIGLAVARRAALAGWSVRVHRASTHGQRERSEPGIGAGASWAAGGMVAPRSEGWPGEEGLLRLGLESLALWHESFLDGLPADVVTARESMVVAVDRADAVELRTVGEWLAAQGHPVTMTAAAGDLEPLLAQGIRHGFVAAGELAVDNRKLIVALEDHCERLGVEWDFADRLQGINQFNVTFSQGIKGLGSTDNDNPMASRAAGRVNFSKIEGTISRTQPLPARFSAYASLYGQYAFNPLLSPEQCGYGGRYFGRAFDPSEMLGDSCWEALGELRYDLPPTAPQITQAQLYAFTDYGQLYTREAAVGTDAFMHGASAGAGLRLAVLKYFNVDLQAAKAIDGPRNDWRFFFIIAAHY